MKKPINLILALTLLLCFQNLLQAQVNEFGLNVGLVGSRYTVSTNRISNNVLLRQGVIKYGPRLGAQLSFGGPRDQNVPYLVLKHGGMLELSACRCGGNTQLLTMNGNGNNSLVDLNYVTWQGDIAALYMAKLNKFRLIGGPTFTYHTYRGVRLSSSDSDFLSAADQINEFYIGYELGMGVRTDKILISARYHTAITSFGTTSEFIPASLNVHQVRLVFSFFLFDRSTGKNWGSIYLAR